MDSGESTFENLLDYSDNENDWCDDDVIMEEKPHSRTYYSQLMLSKEQNNDRNNSGEFVVGNDSENEMSPEMLRDTNQGNKKWKRRLILKDGNLLNIMQQIIFEFIKFNNARTNWKKASEFVIGWCPRSIEEAVLWINDTVKRIIIIDAKVTNSVGGFVTIEGFMLRRSKTSLLNHTKITANRNKILIKMTDYKNGIKRQE